MIGTMQAVDVDPITDPRWHALSRRDGASLFTAPPWLAAVCGTYGFTPRARIALDPAGAARGGLAWVRVDDARGSRLLSLPFCDRADPLVPDGDTWATVAEPVMAESVIADGTPFTLRCLDDSPAAADDRLRRVGDAAWHATPLDAGLDDVWQRLAGPSRRNLAAATRRGVTVQIRDDLDAVRAMHRLHVRLRKGKYRLLAQPLALFERIWAEFAPYDGCVTLLARAGEGGDVIAAAIFLEWAGALYYKFGASAPEHLRLRPNDAIYWAAIRLAAQRGLHRVDWGLSDRDQPGLVAYKRKWATVERSLLTLHCGTPRRDGPGQALGRELGELTRLLTDPAVPDDITERAGRLLYHYFC